ncbi:unnamed protein product, partial [Didymodactylos carnosus]
YAQRHDRFGEYINLESHQLIWLNSVTFELPDVGVDMLLRKLEDIFHHTKVFSNDQDTAKFIEQTPHTTTYLITSRLQGQILIPKIHNLKNVRSIYIYLEKEEDVSHFCETYTK